LREVKIFWTNATGTYAMKEVRAFIPTVTSATITGKTVNSESAAGLDSFENLISFPDCHIV